MLKYFFHTFGSGTVLEPQTLSYKEGKNKHILKTVCPISIKQKLYWPVY